MFERRLCRRNPLLGEASGGGVETPSDFLPEARASRGNPAHMPPSMAA
jgi:hypothetical protein